MTMAGAASRLRMNFVASPAGNYPRATMVTMEGVRQKSTKPVPPRLMGRETDRWSGTKFIPFSCSKFLLPLLHRHLVGSSQGLAAEKIPASLHLGLSYSSGKSGMLPLLGVLSRCLTFSPTLRQAPTTELAP